MIKFFKKPLLYARKVVILHPEYEESNHHTVICGSAKQLWL